MYGRRLLDGYFFIARICFLAGIGKKMGVFGMIFVVYAARNNCGLQKNKSLITALSFNLNQIDNLLILIKKFRNIKSYFYEGAVPRAAINPSFLKRMTIVEVVRGHLFCLLLP